MLLQESLYEGVLFSCCFLVGEVSVCPLCEVVFKRCPERGMLVVSGLAGVFNDVVGFGLCLLPVFRGHVVEQALLLRSPDALHVYRRNNPILFVVSLILGSETHIGAF